MMPLDSAGVPVAVKVVLPLPGTLAGVNQPTVEIREAGPGIRALVLWPARPALSLVVLQEDEHSSGRSLMEGIYELVPWLGARCFGSISDKDWTLISVLACPWAATPVWVKVSMDPRAQWSSALTTSNQPLQGWREAFESTEHYRNPTLIPADWQTDLHRLGLGTWFESFLLSATRQTPTPFWKF